MYFERTRIELFEGLLFDNGRLNINPETYLDEKEKEYFNHLKKTKARPKRLVEQLMEYERYDFLWIERFNGKIPSHWLSWQKIIRDLSIAKGLIEKVNYEDENGKIKSGLVQLSSPIIDSAVSHSHWAVRLAAGREQFLDQYQLMYVLTAQQPGMNYDGILFNQMHGPKGAEMIERASELKASWKRDEWSDDEKVKFKDRFVVDYLNPYRSNR